MAVVDTLREIRERVESELTALSSSAELDALRVKVLGKKGELTALLKGMGQLAPEERPVVGAQINEVRQWLTEKMKKQVLHLAKKSDITPTEIARTVHMSQIKFFKFCRKHFDCTATELIAKMQSKD